MWCSRYQHFTDAALRRGSPTRLHSCSPRPGNWPFPRAPRCKGGRCNGKAGAYKSLRYEDPANLTPSLCSPRVSRHLSTNPASAPLVSGAAEESYCKCALIHPCEGAVWQLIHLVLCTPSGAARVPPTISRFLPRSASFNPRQGHHDGCLANKPRATRSAPSPRPSCQPAPI